MKFKKNSWCPLTKDYCKGSLCVCHEIKGKVDYTRPGNHTEQPFCQYFQVYLPGDKPEDDGHGL